MHIHGRPTPSPRHTAIYTSQTCSTFITTSLGIIARWEGREFGCSRGLICAFFVLSSPLCFYLFFVIFVLSSPFFCTVISFLCFHSLFVLLPFLVSFVLSSPLCAFIFSVCFILCLFPPLWFHLFFVSFVLSGFYVFFVLSSATLSPRDICMPLVTGQLSHVSPRMLFRQSDRHPSRLIRAFYPEVRGFVGATPGGAAGAVAGGRDTG